MDRRSGMSRWFLLLACLACRAPSARGWWIAGRSSHRPAPSVDDNTSDAFAVCSRPQDASAPSDDTSDDLAVCSTHQLDASRRLAISTMVGLLAAPNLALSAPASATDLDSIDWATPKARGLNIERMADALNDSIKETSWLVTGRGRPEYFSDTYPNTFIYRNREDNVAIEDYEKYCRRMNKRYKGGAATCELVCCSVTNPNTIAALWRFEGPVQGRHASRVIRSTFRTSDDLDGLVVSQTDEVLVKEDAPSAESLAQKCNWSSCTVEGIDY